MCWYGNRDYHFAAQGSDLGAFDEAMTRVGILPVCIERVWTLRVPLHAENDASQLGSVIRLINMGKDGGGETLNVCGDFCWLRLVFFLGIVGSQRQVAEVNDS